MEVHFNFEILNSLHVKRRPQQHQSTRYSFISDIMPSSNHTVHHQLTYSATATVLFHTIALTSKTIYNDDIKPRLPPKHLQVFHLYSIGRMADITSSTDSCWDDTTLSIRRTIQTFLSRCAIPYHSPTPDPKFLETCFKAAIEKGFPLTGKGSFRPFIVTCSTIGSTAFAHLTDERARIFVTLYTASLLYMEHTFENEIEGSQVHHFIQRFVRNEPQGDAVQDAFCKMLLVELPTLWGPFASNLIIPSTINFINALLLESHTKGMQISAEAVKYPTFSRLMSGAGEAFALFIFPPDVPLHLYIQALPDIVVFVNHCNDIFSFYKEELGGDDLNYVSLVAALHESSKMEALGLIANDVADAHQRALRILSPSKDACEAYARFSDGYVGFHTSSDRYRVVELDL